LLTAALGSNQPIGHRCKDLGIDEDHVYFVLGAGLYPLPYIVKKLKGYTTKKLLQEYPWLKRQYFWGSGLWKPSYYFDSLGQGIEQILPMLGCRARLTTIPPLLCAGCM